MTKFESKEKSMDYSLIVRPLIGAVIGYVTNYIAVKMLFRPLNPIKMGKVTLPFTPGVVPKNKERIANSVGETISRHLLTEEAFSKELLSEEKKSLVDEIREEAVKQMPQQNTHRPVPRILYTDGEERVL